MTSNLLDDRGKCRFIPNSEIGQHFPVEPNVSVMQTRDETAVGHPMLTHGSVDPGNPETTEHALAVAAIAIGVLACAHDSLLGDPEYVLATTTIAFGQRDDFLVTGTGGHATFDSGHYGLLKIK
jgi:hypothetical protein